MHRIAQIVFLVSIGVLVFEGTWLSKTLNLPLFQVLPALLTYISLLSLLLYGSAQGWVRGFLVKAFQTLLGTRRKSIWSASFALLGVVLLGVVCYIEYHRVRPNLYLSVLEGKAPLGTSATLTIKNKQFDEKHESKTDKDGDVAFQIKNSGLWQIILFLDDRNGKRIARLPAELIDVKKLPRRIPINAKDIPKDQWEIIEFHSMAKRTKMSLLQAPPKTPYKEIGDKRFADTHAPWGLSIAEVIIYRRAYVVGFDPSRRLARWVTYQLDSSHLLDAMPKWSRGKRWRPDPLIGDQEQSSLRDYRLAGYDKGSLVTYTHVLGLGKKAAEETLFFTVIAPQSTILNRIAWYKLEKLARKSAVQDSRVWVLAGPIFANIEGVVANHDYLMIGDTPVPTHYFMVIARRDRDGLPNTRAFIVPNSLVFDHVESDRFLTSIDEIERSTGLNLFDQLPKTAEQVLESVRHKGVWNFPEG